MLLARRARNGAPILAFFALWAAGSIVVSIVGSPIGDNWTRLDEFVFPLMVLTAVLARFRPRALAVAALAVALRLQRDAVPAADPVSPRRAPGDARASGSRRSTT